MCSMVNALPPGERLPWLTLAALRAACLAGVPGPLSIGVGLRTRAMSLAGATTRWVGVRRL